MNPRFTLFPLLVLTLASPTLAPAQVSRSPLDSAVAACQARDTATRWMEVVGSWSNETGLQWSNDSLRRELIALAEADQAARAGMVTDSLRDSSFARRMATRDSLDEVALRAIVTRYGWPTRSMVGAAGAHAAWLIAQHNAPIRTEALRLMRELPAGEVSPADLAMLEDRVMAMDSGKTQRYGSQMHEVDGVMTFYPIDDIAGLEDRRADAGLPPLSMYICFMEAMTGEKIPDPRALRESP